MNDFAHQSLLKSKARVRIPASKVRRLIVTSIQRVASEPPGNEDAGSIGAG
jgi:hypothetical protein